MVGRIDPIRGWSEALDLGLRWMVVANVAWSMLAFSGIGYRTFLKLGLLGRLSLGWLAIILVTMVVAMLIRRRSPIFDIAITAATAAGLAGYVAATRHVVDVGWWPMLTVTAVEAGVLAFGSRIRWTVGLAGLVVFQVLQTGWTVHHGDPLRTSLLSAVSGVQIVIMLVLAIQALREVGGVSDAAQHLRVATVARETRLAAADRASREVERFLHDEVLAALLAVAAGMRVGAGAVREMAAIVTDRLGEEAPPVGAEDLSAGLARVAASVRVKEDVRGKAEEPPPEVAQAILLAAAEVCRNVVRHSGTDEVTMRITALPQGLEVALTDQGKGFDVAKLGQGGLRHSVKERMVEVGGTAHVQSGLTGTTVTLRWQQAKEPDPFQASWTALEQPLARPAIPALVALVLLGLLVLPDLHRPWLGVAAVWVITVSGILLVHRVMRGMPVRVRAAITIPIVGVVGLTLNVLAMHPSDTNGWHWVTAGGVTALLLVIIVRFPLWIALTGAATVWTAMVLLGWWRFGLDVLLNDLVGALSAQSIVIGAIVLKVLVQLVGRRMQQDQRVAEASRSRAYQLGVQREIRTERLRSVRALVGSFLEALAGGDLDPLDSRTRERARRLEAVLREDLRFEGTPTAVAEAMDRVRGLGWHVELRLSRAVLIDQEAEVLGLLSAFDHPAGGSGPVVLSALRSLSAVIDDPRHGSLQAWSERIDLNLDRQDQWCRLVWIGLPAAEPARVATVPDDPATAAEGLSATLGSSSGDGGSPTSGTVRSGEPGLRMEP